MFRRVGAAVLVAAAAAGCRLPLPARLPHPLVVNIALSVAGFFATSRMTLAMVPAFVKARLSGIDLNKPQTKRDASGALVRPYEGPVVPEAMGLVACTVYLVCMFVFIPFPFLGDVEKWGTDQGGSWGAPQASGSSSYHFPHAYLSKFLCALLAICCMSLLGFADNVLDLRWRDRLWLPLAASLPLLMVYAVDGGGTVITMPRFVAPLVGASIRIGAAYYVFMACLAIFCTNSINILAGVNGLECGQSVVIAATVLANNAIQLWRWPEGPLHDNNLFSLYLVLPFFACSLGLLRHNWHPAKVFVGDTYCYFAGMTFAVSAILGHNTKTVLLFFVPQILNFLYSVPQLFRAIPCPRHRMPGYLAKTDQLCMSYAEFAPAELGRAGRLVLALCERLRLAKVERLADGTVRLSNLTIINFALYALGPMHEARLTTVLLLLQLVCNAAALLVRYQLAGLFYEVVR
jgi:UDP-N-acetylglucosamine--dolichyl-phosphate N-acetylglucosaminephosphotransferase